jgi:hypothetical protein
MSKKVMPVGADQLDVGRDAVLGSEIQYFLRFGDATDGRAVHAATCEDEVEGVGRGMRRGWCAPSASAASCLDAGAVNFPAASQVLQASPQQALPRTAAHAGCAA